MVQSEMSALATQNFKQFKRKRNYVYLNNKQGFSFRPKDSFITLVCGRTGTGKTYLTGVISSQFPNVVYLDPTAGNSFRKTLKELGVANQWNFFRFSKDSGKGILKFNICECGARVVDAIFYRIPKNDKERRRKNAFQKFFNQPKELKNWQSFKQLCEDEKLDAYLPDFEMIFDKEDKGVDLISVQSGKNVVSIENIGIQTLSMGIFFAMMIEARANNPYLEFYGKDFLLICIDEAQAFAKFGTSLGNAMAEMTEQCRKFGMGILAAGSIYKGATSGFHPSIRQQKSFTFLFKTEGSIKGYKEENLDIIEDDWEQLGQYEVYFFDSFNQVVRQRVLPDTFFLNVDRLVKEDEQKKVVSKPLVGERDYLVALNRGFSYTLGHKKA